MYIQLYMIHAAMHIKRVCSPVIPQPITKHPAGAELCELPKGGNSEGLREPHVVIVCCVNELINRHSTRRFI